MIDLLAKRMDLVVEILLVSNTPAYLFKRLRSALADVAREVPLDSIVKELRRELSDGTTQELDRAAYSYALFVLMTYESYADIGCELCWIRESGLRWITEIIRYYEQSVAVSKSVTIDVPVRLNKPSFKISVAENNVLQSLDIDEV